LVTDYKRNEPALKARCIGDELSGDAAQEIFDLFA
jgi:hypothetical protein